MASQESMGNAAARTRLVNLDSLEDVAVAAVAACRCAGCWFPYRHVHHARMIGSSQHCRSYVKEVPTSTVHHNAVRKSFTRNLHLLPSPGISAQDDEEPSLARLPEERHEVLCRLKASLASTSC